MARTRIVPTYDDRGRPAYDVACECGLRTKPPVTDAAEAGRQLEEHQREHDQ